MLTALIAIGGFVACSRYPESRSIEISSLPTLELEGDVYIGGAVSNPGLYPLIEGDSLQDIMDAAGGTISAADLIKIEIHIPGCEEEEQPQKIDINRADAWLLEALPGIGEVKAQAIVKYRNQNGLFRSTYQITEVEGIGDTIYRNIEHLITVSD